jgi:hypothetical protein
VVAADKQRKIWDILSEMRSYLRERPERTVLRPALISVNKNYAVYSVFPSDMTSHSKITNFNRECIASLVDFRLLDTVRLFRDDRTLERCIG